ncbi:hypothetical protein AAKU55_005794, partial [Oxalobacteraceae bacterium GrIS 1.11]
GAAASALDTGTLTHSDIANHTTMEASSIGVSGSATSGGTGANNTGPGGSKLTDAGKSGQKANTPIVVSTSEHDASTTRSGIGAGTLTIRDEAGQVAATGKDAAQTVAGINRKVETGVDTSGKIANNFDKKSVQATLDATAAFVQAAAPLAANAVGDIGNAKEEAAKREATNYGELAKAAAARGDTDQANAYSAQAAEAETTAKNWGDNGVYRVGLHVAAQGLIGGVAGGGAGALGAATGVVAGNQGQQLGKVMGEAEADKQGLKGQARIDFVNTYQQTMATLGGALGGLVASGASGQGGMNALSGVAQGANAAATVDINNRQLHAKDKLDAKNLASKSGGKYSEKEIQDALRYASLKDGNGKVIVAEGTQETFVKNTNIKNGEPIQDTLKADNTMPLVSVPGDQITLLEKPPTRPGNDLMAYITANTGGKDSPYVLTPGPTYTSSQSLPVAPPGTTRVTVTVDGAVYFPLVASCPAASCTNGDPIANAIPDAGTKAYNEAVSRKSEKEVNVLSGMLGVGGALIRGVTAVTELATTASAAARVAEAAAAVNTATPSVTRNLMNDPEELDFVLSGGRKDWSFYREVVSSKGPIEIKSKSYRVDEDKASLLIDEVHVFPTNQPNLKLGFREVKSLFQSMVDDLGSVGFENVTIQGQRISGAKFINNAPNKIQSITLIPKKPGQQ